MARKSMCVCATISWNRRTPRERGWGSGAKKWWWMKDDASFRAIGRYAGEGGGERTEWKKRKSCRRRPANNYLDHLSSRLLYLLSSSFLLIFVVVYTFYTPSFSPPTLRRIRGRKLHRISFYGILLMAKNFSRWSPNGSIFLRDIYQCFFFEKLITCKNHQFMVWKFER